MRLVSTLSYSSAKYIADQLKENHEKRRVYYYGFLILIGGIVKLMMLLGISLILGILIPSVIIALTFASLRTLAGGYHMRTYGKCMVISLGMFLAAGLISQYTYQYINAGYLFVFISAVYAFSFYILLNWAPSDTPNKPITKPEDIRKFKRMSLIFITLILMFSFLLISYGQNYYVIPVFFAILIESFTVMPKGYEFFAKIDGKH